MILVSRFSSRIFQKEWLHGIASAAETSTVVRFDARTGVIGPLIAFLDRNLLRFSQPVRDTIGIGFLILVAAYFLNGLIGSTYVRGELWVQRAGDKSRGEGWQVMSGENQSVVNHSGFWTLPVYGNGIPGVIRLVVDDDGRDDKGQRRAPRNVGVVKVYGPLAGLEHLSTDEQRGN